MRLGGVNPRSGGGFPWTYGPGVPAFPAATRHGATPQYPWSANQGAYAAFRLVLTGQPMNDPRPRGPIVTGPPVHFPRPASTGARYPGGVGTDLFDESTWQRIYRSGG
jgi:hypothetical protein